MAASIHLGLLPTDHIPHPKEFAWLPHYDKTESFEIGTPFFMGKDEYNSEIYILGMGSDRMLIKKAIYSFLRQLGLKTEDLLMVDTLKNINLITKVGGFTSRRLGLISIGRPLTIIGIQRKYWDFIQLVDNVKNTEKQILKST